MSEAKFKTRQRCLFIYLAIFIYVSFSIPIYFYKHNYSIKTKCFPRKYSDKKLAPLCPNFSMSKTEQFLNLPLIESFREAQEEEQMPLFSGVQNANASGS